MDLIIRMSDKSMESEVLMQDEGGINEKIVKNQSLIKLIRSVLGSQLTATKGFDNFDGNVLSYFSSEKSEHYFYRLPECKIKCTYQDKGYSINHPNSVFDIEVSPEGKYMNIKAYSYKKWDGEKTKLFNYPMPNQLGGNSMCTGTVDRTFTNCRETVMNVIEANYTHTVMTLKRNSKYLKTDVAFEYLSKNKFPYEELDSLGTTIGKVISKER